MTKTSVFIVRSGSGSDAPESYIHGLYPTEDHAMQRIGQLLKDEEVDEDDVWFDVVDVGSQGADCFLSNR